MYIAVIPSSLPLSLPSFPLLLFPSSSLLFSSSYLFSITLKTKNSRRRSLNPLQPPPLFPLLDHQDLLQLLPKDRRRHPPWPDRERQEDRQEQGGGEGVCGLVLDPRADLWAGGEAVALGRFPGGQFYFHFMLLEERVEADCLILSCFMGIVFIESA